MGDVVEVGVAAGAVVEDFVFEEAGGESESLVDGVDEWWPGLDGAGGDECCGVAGEAEPVGGLTGVAVAEVSSDEGIAERPA